VSFQPEIRVFPLVLKMGGLFRPASAVSPGGDAIDAVDEGTQLPQKLVLRIVRAEYTKLAETSVFSEASVAKKNP
jgi:hypothetical protein